ncbi:unnamed protein product [Oppiella nova]|uniref:Uncharacterized protein n=1 Tax=Oppiella nova TaxID=334625 RepID=A0A7R9LHM8_9ACAR|nr:unnamed protein product [Oppiella nova]CAG2163752.1 unnamed protein product [Oppiella nova]
MDRYTGGTGWSSFGITYEGLVYGWGCNDNCHLGLARSGKLWNELNEINQRPELKELRNLAKVRSEYVVLYYNSWIERNALFIQMEYCSQNLKNILKLKRQVFGRQSGETMDCVEYFFSCEIFRQILESVHALEAPVAKLKLILSTMMSTPEWHQRPECSEILSEYNEWPIDRNILANDPRFDGILSRLQSNDNHQHNCQ